MNFIKSWDLCIQFTLICNHLSITRKSLDFRVSTSLLLQNEMVHTIIKQQKKTKTYNSERTKKKNLSRLWLKPFTCLEPRFFGGCLQGHFDAAASPETITLFEVFTTSVSTFIVELCTLNLLFLIGLVSFCFSFLSPITSSSLWSLPPLFDSRTDLSFVETSLKSSTLSTLKVAVSKSFDDAFLVSLKSSWSRRTISSLTSQTKF